MRADQYLVRHGYFDTRARAQAAIAAGRVRVDGMVIDKPSRAIAEGARVEAQAAHPWVSRAALKLVAGLDGFGVDPADALCLDVGASTGGFSEVLLARGAAHVTAVDVGRGQLHASLKDHPRLTSLEGRDARSLTRDDLPGAPGLVVCDASFIPLSIVLPVPLLLAQPGAALIALFKPQFEVGPAHVGKGGIVKDDAAAHAAMTAARGFLDASGWAVRAVMDSPVAGGDGNRERLIHAVKN
ncbi:TlyA family RNA methyltransferase [Alkalicaulis satelles]|uniref:TlyA family RNA methyltransferase n=1 Tax=Alkalicaulis satelles TaxID=2609175 RepID=A0A5M6ZA96_9PROT|nr:TlyA family RNA methyltransferase [Alkalicaulis satelles]KAA5801622.1 TlyA family RNA methyltransferase [Alkalicaulis satelles]